MCRRRKRTGMPGQDYQPLITVRGGGYEWLTACMLRQDAAHHQLIVCVPLVVRLSWLCQQAVLGEAGLGCCSRGCRQGQEQTKENLQALYGDECNDLRMVSCAQRACCVNLVLGFVHSSMFLLRQNQIQVGSPTKSSEVLQSWAPTHRLEVEVTCFMRCGRQAVLTRPAGDLL